MTVFYVARTTALVILAGMTLESGTAAAVTKPDFSGTWTLDLAKSTFASTQPPSSSVLTIVHKEPSVRISSVQTIRKLETKKEMNLTTDGTETPNQIRTTDGEEPTKSVSNWEGDRLVTTYRAAHGGHFDEFRDAWDLSDAGNILTIVREVKLPNGRFTLTLVYKKH